MVLYFSCNTVATVVALFVDRTKKLAAKKVLLDKAIFEGSSKVMVNNG